MKTWAGTNMAVKKINTAIAKLTPPDPDEQFEDMRRDVLKFTNKWGEYLSEKVQSIAAQEEAKEEAEDE